MLLGLVTAKVVNQRPDTNHRLDGDLHRCCDKETQEHAVVCMCVCVWHNEQSEVDYMTTLSSSLVLLSLSRLPVVLHTHTVVEPEAVVIKAESTSTTKATVFAALVTEGLHCSSVRREEHTWQGSANATYTKWRHWAV